MPGMATSSGARAIRSVCGSARVSRATSEPAKATRPSRIPRASTQPNPVSPASVAMRPVMSMSRGIGQLDGSRRRQRPASRSSGGNDDPAPSGQSCSVASAAFVVVWRSARVAGVARSIHGRRSLSTGATRTGGRTVAAVDGRHCLPSRRSRRTCRPLVEKRSRDRVDGMRVLRRLCLGFLQRPPRHDGQRRRSRGRRWPG